MIFGQEIEGPPTQSIYSQSLPLKLNKNISHSRGPTRYLKDLAARIKQKD